MNKFAITVSALSFLAAGSVAAMAASPKTIEPNGQPINAAQLSGDQAEDTLPAANEPDLLSLWANEGVISDQDADQIRGQLERQGDRPGTLAYDQGADAYAFPNQEND